jgi:hypothetical protein
MTDNVTIPNEWQQLHWKQQVNLAQDILASQGKDVPPDRAMEASAARAIIDDEAKRQANEARKPQSAEVPVSERMLSVYVDYDVWVTEGLRVRADKDTPQELPFELAKKMLGLGKARRADPLPGE